MEKPFIYKYKPQSINDFELNNDFKELIESFINIGNLNILLFGNSGSGKTSIINCIINQYYKDDYNSNNILTINSLKDQGISYYRNEVKTFCQIKSLIPNKKKFIILDDIDTINEQNQQTIRNYIDNYYNNIFFISSCANLQKVIDSFQSRILILKIPQLQKNHLENILNNICFKENINISNKSKEFIILLSNLSIKTLINYLEKINLFNNNITDDIIFNMCTNISFTIFQNYTNLCKNKDNLLKAINLIYSIHNLGYSVIDILDNYFLFLKLNDILNDTCKFLIIKLISKYTIIFYNIHEDILELALFTNDLIKILS